MREYKGAEVIERYGGKAASEEEGENADRSRKTMERMRGEEVKRGNERRWKRRNKREKMKEIESRYCDRTGKKVKRMSRNK